MSAGAWLFNLLFPPKCPFCGGVLRAPGLCGKCREGLPWTREQERELRLPGGVRCAAPLWYEEGARAGILRFKFHGRISAADLFGDLLAQCAAECFSGQFDTVTWVPVSPKRLRSRGYDQARLLAESACRRWDMRPTRLLYKDADNPAQSSLHGAPARRANVLGVYRAEEAAVRGRRILLLDDIVTTGSTLAECARALAEAGAAQVVCCALARVREAPPSAHTNGT